MPLTQRIHTLPSHGAWNNSVEQDSGRYRDDKCIYARYAGAR